MVRKSVIDMLNRKIYSYLRNFFKMEKKALLVSDARHGWQNLRYPEGWKGMLCGCSGVQFPQ